MSKTKHILHLCEYCAKKLKEFGYIIIGTREYLIDDVEITIVPSDECEASFIISDSKWVN